jgi:hypothetical protein
MGFILDTILKQENDFLKSVKNKSKAQDIISRCYGLYMIMPVCKRMLKEESRNMELAIELDKVFIRREIYLNAMAKNL